MKKYFIHILLFLYTCFETSTDQTNFILSGAELRHRYYVILVKQPFVGLCPTPRTQSPAIYNNDEDETPSQIQSGLSALPIYHPT